MQYYATMDLMVRATEESKMVPRVRCHDRCPPCPEALIRDCWVHCLSPCIHKDERTSNTVGC
jgi:hypothetical protein